MKRIKNGAGFTMLELIIAVTMAAIVIFAIASVIITISNAIASSNIERRLQIEMNNLARHIADGFYDPITITSPTDPSLVNYGFRGSAKGLWVSSNQSINFKNAFILPAISSVWRNFSAVNGPGGTVTYRRYTASGTVDFEEVIYKAPAEEDLTVIFSDPVGRTLNISVSVTRNFNGKTLTGSVVTSACLRNFS